MHVAVVSVRLFTQTDYRLSHPSQIIMKFYSSQFRLKTKLKTTADQLYHFAIIISTSSRLNWLQQRDRALCLFLNLPHSLFCWTTRFHCKHNRACNFFSFMTIFHPRRSTPCHEIKPDVTRMWTLLKPTSIAIGSRCRASAKLLISVADGSLWDQAANGRKNSKWSSQHQCRAALRSFNLHYMCRLAQT